MNYSLTIIFMFFVLISSLVLITRQKHLLMALLALESLMLSSVIIIPISMNSSNMSMSILSIILLTFGACEASLGLSLMVIMSRTCGSDLMKLLSINKC